MIGRGDISSIYVSPRAGESVYPRMEAERRGSVGMRRTTFSLGVFPMPMIETRDCTRLYARSGAKGRGGTDPRLDASA